jgi:transcriptional regulator with XRE-family HTH domain
MDMKKIGAFLKELRKERKLTQEQLAERLNVSNRTISRWETGANMPDLDIIIQLADYYEIDLRELLNGERKGRAMENEQRDTLLKVADYNNLREKMLIRNICLFVITGIVAWGVSFLTMARFLNEVTGAIYVLAYSLFALVFYSICVLMVKVNRTTEGLISLLAGAFTAIIISSIIQLVLFFGNGSYHNYGIIGAYYSLVAIIISFLLTGIVVTVVNKKRAKKQSLS